LFDNLSDNQLFKYYPAPWSKYNGTARDLNICPLQTGFHSSHL